MIKQTLKLLELMLVVALPVTVPMAFTSPEFALISLGISIAVALITWVLYTEAMRLKRKRDRESLKLWHYPWAVVVLFIGIPFDAILNVIVGAYWKEWPKWTDSEWLLTARLDRWAHDDDNPKRQDWAQRVCKRLNKHDEDHCFSGDK